MLRLDHSLVLLPVCFLAVLVSGTAPSSTPVSKAEEKLFTSQAFTKKNSFTKGIEGPTVNKAGDLFVVNFARKGTVGRITPDGDASHFLDLPEGSIGCGMRFGPKGELYIADYKTHSIFVVPPGANKPVLHANEPKMSQPNDLAVDKTGVIWASDPDWKKKKGRIWRITPDGKREVALSESWTTNGIELSPDESELYVTNSHGREVWGIKVGRDGKLGEKRLIHKFKNASVDGIKADKDGNLYVARIEKGTIAKLSKDGKLIREIQLLGKNPTNLTFGGPDGRTIYVTQMDGGFVETFRVDTSGR